MAPSRGLARPSLRLLTLRHRPVRHAWRPHTHASAITSSFHTSATRRSSLIETGITLTHSGIASLHNTLGLPWYLALPLAGLLVRTSLIFPLQLLAQRNRQQQASLNPQVLAARHEIQQKVIDRYNDLGPEKCSRILALELAKKRAQLGKENGIPTWPLWATWAQLPVWLLLVETIRRMAGAGQGLLGMMGGEKAVDGEGVGVMTATETTAGQEAGQSMLSGDIAMATPMATGLDTQTTLTGTGALDPLFEPSLAQGGMLWFPDLLAPDPVLILPFTLSAILYSSIAWEERLAAAAGIARPRWSVGLTRGAKLVALVIGPATLQVPAAVLLYWITSAGTAFWQKSILDRLLPIDRSWVAESQKTDWTRDGGRTLNGSPQGQTYRPIRPTKYRPKRTLTRR